MILLDGAQGLILIPIYFIVHVIFTVLVEGSLLYAFRYQRFKKSLLTAFKVNLVSLITGIPLINVFSEWSRDLEGVFPDITHHTWIIVIYFFQTFLVEYVALILFNKRYSRWKLLGVNLLMNVITYIGIVAILEYIS